MIPLPQYAKIKDRYCIGYFGDSQDMLTDLQKARPVIERELPGLQVYICCADEKVGLFGERVIPKSQLQDRIKEVAYYRELDDESVVDLLKESNIPYDEELFTK